MALFELYKEAKVEKNKGAVLDVQLQVMIAMGKITQILGKPVEGGE